MLYDNYNRPINYLRLAVTDHCNLRCLYCMPEEGIPFEQRKDLLSYEEMERLVSILAKMGISKVRITGGEPFVRKQIIHMIERIHQIEGIEEINLTTNGTLTLSYIEDIRRLGIKSVNLSLDTLDKERFLKITRRDMFDKVMETLYALLDANIKVKLNTVVMEQYNIDDIIPLVNFTKDHSISVRFIEEMPFNGIGKRFQKLKWNIHSILEHIKTTYPELNKLTDPKGSTSFNYQVPNFKGTVGIIAAYSRLFCGSCNRIRITPKGVLKTCLYDEGVFNIRDYVRQGVSDEDIAEQFVKHINKRPKDGFEAAERRNAQPKIKESMATIGG